MENNQLWWQGPTWLVQERLWPPAPVYAQDFSTVSAVTLCARHKDTVATTILTDQFERRFSCWNTCVKWFLCCLPPLVSLYRIRQLTPSQSFGRAELVLIRLIQQKYFARELRFLNSEVTIHSNLNLFLHSDGVIRCKGRNETAPIAWETANPALLPRESPLVRALIHTLHRSSGHAGVESTIANFRRRFWVTRIRSLINSVIRTCNLCRRWGGGPYKLPVMPLLPHVRTSPVVPFRNIGVDCVGPLKVVGSDQIIRKVYGVICTCLVVRAIHLELVDDMSGEQFLLAPVSYTHLTLPTIYSV